MQRFRFLGSYAYRWYARPMALAVMALIVGGFGISYIHATNGAHGWYGGLIALTAALGIGVFAYAALWFQPPVATLNEGGAVTLTWPRSSTTFDAGEAVAIRWIRPRSWRCRPMRGLENYRIELADRRLRVEATPSAFREFGRAIKAINPGMLLDVPVTSSRSESARERTV